MCKAKVWSVSMAILLVSGFLCAAAESNADDESDAERDAEELVEVELSTVGVDMRLRAPVVLLREAESEQLVPIWVGLTEAQAIYRALRDISMPRPMTHDLLADVIEQLGAQVEEVVIHDLREGTYHAMLRLVMGDDGEVREVDSRPSDGMALALRAGARIRITQRILDDVPPFDFAIPQEMEPVVRALGITVVGLSEQQRQRHELPEDTPGVRVSAVMGDAYEQGLRRDDVIIEVNGESVSDPMSFFESAQQAMRSGRVSLRAWREGETFEIDLEVAPPSPQRRDPRQRPEGVEV